MGATFGRPSDDHQLRRRPLRTPLLFEYSSVLWRRPMHSALPSNLHRSSHRKWSATYDSPRALNSVSNAEGILFSRKTSNDGIAFLNEATRKAVRVVDLVRPPDRHRNVDRRTCPERRRDQRRTPARYSSPSRSGASQPSFGCVMSTVSTVAPALRHFHLGEALLSSSQQRQSASCQPGQEETLRRER
jgi:hypothetical protein